MSTRKPLEFQDALLDWDNGDVEPFASLMLNELDHILDVYKDKLGI